MRVLIIGAGGHGQVVADILLQMQEAGSRIHPIGFLDDNPAKLGQEFLQIPVLGGINERRKFEHDGVMIAIGHNRTRQTIFREMKKEGVHIATAQHPQSIIAPGVSIGSGSAIMAGVVVNTGSEIGENTILNTACSVDHHCHIGDHVHIAPGVHLGGDVEIKEGTLIGIGATVMPQCQIGAWATVGAGSLVHRDVARLSTVAGVPAQDVKEN